MKKSLFLLFIFDFFPDFLFSNDKLTVFDDIKSIMNYFEKKV